MLRFGARLVDSSFHVIPIIPGLKAPGQYRKDQWIGYHAWSKHCDRPSTLWELKIWSAWPDCGIGIACGNVVGLDIDVLDGEAVMRIEQLARSKLGDTPAVRIGHAPKRLLVYRATKPFSSIKRHPLEILGKGAQFVAYAIHPDTGQPYHWPNEGLADLDLDMLPAITEDMAHAFLREAIELVPPSLRQKRLGSPRSAEFFYGGGGDLRGTIEGVTAALEWLPNDDLDYDSWIDVGHAIKAAIGEDGIGLWCSWSRSSNKSGVKDRHTPEKKWCTFKPHSIGAGSIYRYAMDNGWVPPIGMIINGAEADRMAEVDAATGGIHPAAEMLRKLGSGNGHAEEGNGYAAAGAEGARVGEGNGYAAEGVEDVDTAAAIPTPALTADEIIASAGNLLAEIVDWMTSTAIYPQPFLALAAAITAIATCAGRRFSGPMDVRTNIYCIAIAASGSGKEHQLTCLNNLFFAADLIELFAGEEIASGAAIESSIAQHAVQLFQIDEFGHFLKSVLNPRAVNSHRRDILVKLTKYTGAATRLAKGTEYANKKERQRVDVHQPCVCLYGTTVAAPLWEAISCANLDDGSIARMLCFETDENYPDPRKPEISARDVPQSIIDALRRLVAGDADAIGFAASKSVMLDGRHPPGLINVNLGPEADPLANAMMREQVDLKRQHQKSPFGPVVARWFEHVHRLALIRALSRDQLTPVITANDLTWARHLVDHCLHTLVADANRYLADTEHEATLKRLIDILRQRGRMTGSQLARATQFLSRRTRNDAIAQLIEAGLVLQTIHRINGPGRPGYTVELVKYGVE